MSLRPNAPFGFRASSFELRIFAKRDRVDDALRPDDLAIFAVHAEFAGRAKDCG
jgi:hypothetical protein